VRTSGQCWPPLAPSSGARWAWFLPRAALAAGCVSPGPDWCELALGAWRPRTRAHPLGSACLWTYPCRLVRQFSVASRGILCGPDVAWAAWLVARTALWCGAVWLLAPVPLLLRVLDAIWAHVPCLQLVGCAGAGGCASAAQTGALLFGWAAWAALSVPASWAPLAVPWPLGYGPPSSASTAGPQC
jgi:hypothetical protein